MKNQQKPEVTASEVLKFNALLDLWKSDTERIGFDLPHVLAALRLYKEYAELFEKQCPIICGRRKIFNPAWMAISLLASEVLSVVARLAEGGSKHFAGTLTELAVSVVESLETVVKKELDVPNSKVLKEISRVAAQLPYWPTLYNISNQSEQIAWIAKVAEKIRPGESSGAKLRTKGQGKRSNIKDPVIGLVWKTCRQVQKIRDHFEGRSGFSKMADNFPLLSESIPFLPVSKLEEVAKSEESIEEFLEYGKDRYFRAEETDIIRKALTFAEIDHLNYPDWAEQVITPLIFRQNSPLEKRPGFKSPANVKTREGYEGWVEGEIRNALSTLVGARQANKS